MGTLVGPSTAGHKVCVCLMPSSRLLCFGRASPFSMRLGSTLSATPHAAGAAGSAPPPGRLAWLHMPSLSNVLLSCAVVLLVALQARFVTRVTHALQRS